MFNQLTENEIEVLKQLGFIATSDGKWFYEINDWEFIVWKQDTVYFVKCIDALDDRIETDNSFEQWNTFLRELYRSLDIQKKL